MLHSKSTIQRYVYVLPVSDWLGINGTFSTNRLYHAFEKYAEVKKFKLKRKLKILRLGNA